MIILSDYYFDTEGLTEQPNIGLFSSQRYSAVGRLITTQLRANSRERACTVLVGQQGRANLEYLAALNGYMDFTDYFGVSYLTSNGVDDATHKYNTGAVFKAGQDLTFNIQQANGSEACDQKWQVQLTLVLNYSPTIP